MNAAALDLCLARIRAEVSCEEFLADTTAFFPPEFDECQDVFSGPGEGDDCENTIECVSLGADYECLLGKCRVIPYQDLNEPCFRTTSKGFTGRGGTYWSSPDSYEVGAGQCLISDGLYCRDGTCVSTLAEGANCSDDFEGCATKLYCRDDVCSPYLPTGSSCGEEDRCLGGLCLDGECTRLRAAKGRKFSRSDCHKGQSYVRRSSESRKQNPSSRSCARRVRASAPRTGAHVPECVALNPPVFPGGSKT